MFLSTSRLTFLAATTIEDVFKSTQESMSPNPGSDRLIALVLGAVGLIVLLIVLQHRRYNKSAPAAVNHQGKLLKDIAKELSLKPAQIKCIKQVADEQGLESPLVLLLCPSLLAKSVQGRDDDQQRILSGLLRQLGH